MLAMALSSRRIRRGRRVAVSGVVTPAADGQVVVLLERKVRGRYRRVRSRRVALNNGRYLRFFKPTRRGLYRVTVRVPGASGAAVPAGFALGARVVARFRGCTAARDGGPGRFRR